MKYSYIAMLTEDFVYNEELSFQTSRTNLQFFSSPSFKGNPQFEQDNWQMTITVRVLCLL